MGPGGQGATAEVAQVHGIGEAVGGRQQRGFRELSQAVQQLSLGEAGIGAPPGQDSLVVGDAAQAIQGGPLPDPETHPSGPGQTPHLLQPGAADPRGHEDLLQWALRPAQGGQHRMAAVNDLTHRP